MDAYITKYALTLGVVKVTNAVKLLSGRLRIDNGDGLVDMYARTEWAATEEEARARVEEMKAHKIAGLRAQIEKIENTQFRFSEQ